MHFENARASQSLPCPICGKPDWCFLTIDSKDGLIQAVCGRSVQSIPEGWLDAGVKAKDGRSIYRKGNRATQHRRKFSQRIEWRRWELPPGPEWHPRQPPETLERGDKIRRVKKHSGPPWTFDSYLTKGRCKIVSPEGTAQESFGDLWELYSADGDAQELEIEYLYPDADGRPIGKVRRRQWSDRRRWYERDSLKTKEVRPYHATSTTDPEHPWIWQIGRGPNPWPLYRQSQALQALDAGDVLFIVAGEQAVETMARLGFVATSPQGGEARQGDIVTALADHLRHAYREGRRPVLILWPDSDPTGSQQWGKLQRSCNNQQLLAATLSPTEVWAEMPDGGDVHDLWRAWRGNIPQIRAAIIAASEQAIDRQERILRAEEQRKHWGAPQDRGSELGYQEFRKARKSEADDADDDGLIEVWRPKTDFNFSIVRELVGSDGGGFQLAVKLADYPGERRIRVAAEDCATKAGFQRAIAKGLGRNVICSLKDDQLAALFRVRQLEYRLFEEGLSFRLAERIGRQPDGYWVFPDKQFSPTGEITAESRSGWVWNDELTGGPDNLSPPEIVQPNPQGFQELVTASREFFRDNWPLALLTMGYVAASCHYETILKAEESFPVLDLYGDMGCGKTQIAKTALALVGHHKAGVMAETTVSAAYERLKITGSLPICLDDPKRDAALSSFFKSLYGGEARNVRGGEKQRFNVQRPHSPLFFTSNMALGEDHQAARSRLIKLFVPRVETGDSASWLAMDQARTAASGIFSQLLQMGYDPSAVRERSAAIAPYLNLAHDRLPRSFGVLLHYAELVARLANDTTDLLGYCAAHVFPRLNTAEEAGDSLLDFVEKLQALQTLGEIGPWNYRVVNKLGSRVLAINLPSVWPVVERAYKLPYDLGNLRAVIEARGGNLRATHQFHRDRNESLASIKSGSSARKTNQRCCEIPLETLTAGDFVFENPENDVNDVNDPPRQHSNQERERNTAINIDVNGTTKDVNGLTSNQKTSEGLDPSPQLSINIHSHPFTPHSQDVNGCNPLRDTVSGSHSRHSHHSHLKHADPDFDQKNGQKPESVLSAENDQGWEVPTRLQRGDRLFAWAGDRWDEAEYLGKYSRGQRLSALTGKLEAGIRIRWNGGTREEVAIALPDCRIKQREIVPQKT